MSRNVIETVMGAVVLVIAALFLFFAYSTAQVRSVRGYEVSAVFSRVDGVREGGDVRISGIRVGSILSLSLDPKTYDAVVRMNIEPNVQLATDTVAEIRSNGLLGDKYLALVPGNADDLIKPGGTIIHTQAPMSIEDLIGQYMFSAGQQKPADGGAAKPPGAPEPLSPGK
jgi:phospholipid/cholesterol/gamma-HCH transport system substrate-binding protein